MEGILFIYDLSILLTSTAFVDTKAKYGMPLSRYTVFFENCPLEYNSKAKVRFLLCRFGLKFCPLFKPVNSPSIYDIRNNCRNYVRDKLRPNNALKTKQ